MARNNFDFGQAGADIDIQGATIHNYDHNWIGVDGQTTAQPGRSVAYSRGDIVYHDNSLWICNIMDPYDPDDDTTYADNIEPGTNDMVWQQITVSGQGGVERWSATPGIYAPDTVVVAGPVATPAEVHLYIWEPGDGTTMSTSNDIPGENTGNSVFWRVIGGGSQQDTIQAGIGIDVTHMNATTTIALDATVDQDQTFARRVTVDGPLHGNDGISSSGNVSGLTGTFAGVSANEVTVIGNTGSRTMTTNLLTVAESAILNQPARTANEAVQLEQLQEAENRILTEAIADLEIQPQPVPGEEFPYYRTFEADGSEFASGASMIPVTLPIGTVINNDLPGGEVDIIYPTTGRGAGSRSSTGRRLSGTLYTSPGNVVRDPGGVDVPYNSSARGDERLIGTRYAGYRPFNTPAVEQELWRHNEMWAVGDFEIVLNYRLSADSPTSTPRTLTQRWNDVRMNFECWNHNILYHHKSIPGNLNGGDEAITAGPLLNYFAGAIGLQRTVNGITETAEAPGQRSYNNRGSDGNLFEVRYDGGYIPGSYISIAPNIALNNSGNDNSITERLQTNQSARNFQEFGSNLPDQGNQDMRPLIFTAIPCPWRIISDAIDHVYIGGNAPNRQFPAADVSEITDSGTFTFTRAEHRNFPGEGDDRHMEPHQTITTAEGHEVQAPVIPEVYIEVGTAFGQIVDMELQFTMSNVRYVNEIHQDNNSRVASVTVASMLPRGAGNNVIAGVRGGIWGTGQANTGGVGGGRENTALPPAIFKFLTSPGNSGSPITNEPFAVRTGSGIDVFDYGFLYGGNQSADPTRYFTPEENIRPIPVGGGTGQGYTAVWDYNAYDLAAGSFGATLQSNDGVQDAQGRHLLMRPHFSRPNLYNQDSGEAQLFTNAVKNGRLAPIWDSARAASADNNYQMGDVVRSTGLIPRFGTLDSTVGEDTSRLQLWVARRNPRISGGTVAPEDNQGPAHSFQASKLGDPLWYPLGIHRQLASDYVPLQEDGQRPLDMLHQEFTPGNYTRGRPPTFPGDFEDYEITGLPVFFTQEFVSDFADRDDDNTAGRWSLRTTEADRTNRADGTLGRFNPEVFHFRKAPQGETNTAFSYNVPHAASGGDNMSPTFVFVPNTADGAQPAPVGYMDPYEMLYTNNFTVGDNSGTDADTPNTATSHAQTPSDDDAFRIGTPQNPFTNWSGTRGLLHAIPQSSVSPTGVHNRSAATAQDLYMPNLAVRGSEAAGFTWRAPGGNQVYDPRNNPVTPLDAFTWTDHHDYVRINYERVDDQGNPVNAGSGAIASETLYNILSWNPENGHMRIVRVDYASDDSPNPVVDEPSYQADNLTPTERFLNLARYVQGRRSGVDFLTPEGVVDARVSGTVAVEGRHGLRVSSSHGVPWDEHAGYHENDYVTFNNVTYIAKADIQAMPDPAMNADPATDTTNWMAAPANFNANQLFINADDFEVGAPDNIMLDQADRGGALPFGMFGLIDLFLGQQFTNGGQFTQGGTRHQTPARDYQYTTTSEHWSPTTTYAQGTQVSVIFNSRLWDLNTQNTVASTDDVPGASTFTDTAGLQQQVWINERDPAGEFNYFERYRRRGTDYYWFPNRRAIINGLGSQTFLPSTATGDDFQLKVDPIFSDFRARRIIPGMQFSGSPTNNSYAPLPNVPNIDGWRGRPELRRATGANSIRLVWPSGGRPAVDPNRYYIIYREFSTTTLNVLFRGSDVLPLDPTNNEWTILSDNVYTSETNNVPVRVPRPGQMPPDPADRVVSFNQNLAVYASFPAESYRIFDGVWQNYLSTADPEPVPSHAHGSYLEQWRALLEG